MKDIHEKEDVEFLIDQFYKRVIKDETIGHFFTSVIKLDWTIHIPIMIKFWESILLKNQTYFGNPMNAHMTLNERSKLLPKHFKQWILLWESTINTHFEGPNAKEAIIRANHIATIMQMKLKSPYNER